AALRRKIRVIPVLVGGARMPGRHDLPEALAPLSRRNAIELSETRFHADVNRLIEAIEKSSAVLEKKAELYTTPVAPPAKLASARPPKPKDLPEAAAPANDRTTPVKSTQTKAAIPPVASISATAALKEPRVWTRTRLIIVSAIGTIVILVLLAVFLSRKAAEPYQKAADHGNASAQNNLGELYEDGAGVAKDSGKAAEHYQKAYAQGNADAQSNLAKLYLFGEGVPKDLGKAVELFQRAADQGNARAQTNLGFLYRKGEGVPQDLGK